MLSTLFDRSASLLDYILSTCFDRRTVLVNVLVTYLLFVLFLFRGSRRAKVLGEKLKKEVEEEQKRKKEEDEDDEHFRSFYKATAYHHDKPSNMLYYMTQASYRSISMFSADLATKETTWLFDMDPGCLPHTSPHIAFDESMLFVSVGSSNSYWYDVNKKKVVHVTSPSFYDVGSIVAIGNRLIVCDTLGLTLLEMDESKRQMVEVQKYYTWSACHLQGSTFIHSDSCCLCVSTLKNGRLHRQRKWIQADANVRITRRSKNVFELAKPNESWLYLVEMVDGNAKLHFLRNEKPSNNSTLPLESSKVSFRTISLFGTVHMFIIVSVLSQQLLLWFDNNVGISYIEMIES